MRQAAAIVSSEFELLRSRLASGHHLTRMNDVVWVSSSDTRAGLLLLHPSKGGQFYTASTFAQNLVKLIGQRSPLQPDGTSSNVTAAGSRRSRAWRCHHHHHHHRLHRQTDPPAAPPAAATQIWRLEMQLFAQQWRTWHELLGQLACNHAVGRPKRSVWCPVCRQGYRKQNWLILDR